MFRSPRLPSCSSLPIDRPPQSKRRSPFMLFLLLFLWSILLGIGFAQAQTPLALATPNVESGTLVQAVPIPTPSPVPSPPAVSPAVTTTDEVGERYQLGQALYLENCATCHLALPPAVMPTQTWRDLIQDAQHYGTQLKPLVDPARRIVWQYLSVYSRPVMKAEPVPYRLNQSRLLKALHPKVDLPNPVTLTSCASCHPAAAQFNFRSLTPEWENAP